jgi:hypothetical protein
MVRTLAGYDAPFGFAAMGVVMEPISATMAVVSGLASVGGTIAGMAGTAASMKTQRQAGALAQAGAAEEGRAAIEPSEYRATQLRQQAQEARAAQQRVALETRRKGGLAQSTLRARAAAGGGGATDNSVLNLTGQIAERTEYQSLLDMYKGENAARGLEDSANAAIYEGKVKERGAQYKAAGYGFQTQGTLAASAGSMAQQFGGLVGGIADLGSSFSKINFGGTGTTLPDANNFTNGQLVGRKSVYG